MEKAQQLRLIIAQITNNDPAAIEGGFDLNHRALQGSAGRARLDARIRRELGIKSAATYSARTFADLERQLLGSASEPAPAASTVAAPAASAPSVAAAAVPTAAAAIANVVPAALACGIDMEPIERMPEATDYWDHEFYKQFFSPREIAYCVGQADPRQHFAARWCAKEALKKCDASFAAVEFSRVEVVHDDAGRPIVQTQRGEAWVRLPHAVSLSHAPPFAIAMVIASDPTGAGMADRSTGAPKAAQATPPATTVG